MLVSEQLACLHRSEYTADTWLISLPFHFLSFPYRFFYLPLKIFLLFFSLRVWLSDTYNWRCDSFYSSYTNSLYLPVKGYCGEVINGCVCVCVCVRARVRACQVLVCTCVCCMYVARACRLCRSVFYNAVVKKKIDIHRPRERARERERARARESSHFCFLFHKRKGSWTLPSFMWAHCIHNVWLWQFEVFRSGTEKIIIFSIQNIDGVTTT